MNRIDVSAIQGNPSKFYSTEQEEHNLTKHSQEEQFDSAMPPLRHSHSFTLDQNFKRHAIFQQRERQQPVKSQILAPNKPKIHFKIPSIDDYYIRQSRENINPNKFHRMESMIEAQPRDERFVQTAIHTQHIELKQSRTPRHLWTVIAIISVLLLVWLCCHLPQ